MKRKLNKQESHQYGFRYWRRNWCECVFRWWKNYYLLEKWLASMYFIETLSRRCSLVFPLCFSAYEPTETISCYLRYTHENARYVSLFVGFKFASAVAVAAGSLALHRYYSLRRIKWRAAHVFNPIPTYKTLEKFNALYKCFTRIYQHGEALYS